MNPPFSSSRLLPSPFPPGHHFTDDEAADAAPPPISITLLPSRNCVAASGTPAPPSTPLNSSFCFSGRTPVSAATRALRSPTVSAPERQAAGSVSESIGGSAGVDGDVSVGVSERQNQSGCVYVCVDGDVGVSDRASV